MGEIVSRARLMELAVQARAAGRSIALAAGEFDPLHVGHVRYLQASALEADVLVVAVRDDAVAPPTGRRRPVLLEPEHRAALIAALRCVDVVTLLGETSLASLMPTLRPDVYCRDVREAADADASDAAAVSGVRVAAVGDPQGPSTEEVLTRLAAAAPPDPPSAP